jgi:sugar phosphate isomerase/epimerase
MLKIVKNAGYRGYIEVEYEGPKMSEPDGIRATRRLLEKVRDELA